MECVKKTEEDRKKTEDVRKQEIQLNREADLMDFRRMLTFLLKKGSPLSYFRGFPYKYCKIFTISKSW